MFHIPEELTKDSSGKAGKKPKKDQCKTDDTETKPSKAFKERVIKRLFGDLEKYIDSRRFIEKMK